VRAREELETESESGGDEDFVGVELAKTSVRVQEDDSDTDVGWFENEPNDTCIQRAPNCRQVYQVLGWKGFVNDTCMECGGTIVDGFKCKTYQRGHHHEAEEDGTDGKYMICEACFPVYEKRFNEFLAMCDDGVYALRCCQCGRQDGKWAVVAGHALRSAFGIGDKTPALGQIFDYPKCSFADCPTRVEDINPDKMIKVNPDSKAGGQDWSSVAGFVLCSACYQRFRLSGVFKRSKRRNKRCI